jgi:hypothetical protein
LKAKLAEILFSVALSFKLPPEADTAIRSAAYIIWDRSDEELADSLSDKLIDKISIKINQPIDKLLDSVSAAKSFLDATSQQQATELISLQESTKQHNDIAKALADQQTNLIKHQLLAASAIRRGHSYQPRTQRLRKPYIPHHSSTHTTQLQPTLRYFNVSRLPRSSSSSNMAR